MTDIWYRRFDTIVITDPEELDAEQHELLTWLLAFDDVTLGVGRRTRRRIWCEHALNTQWQIRQTGLWPLDDDDAPTRSDPGFTLKIPARSMPSSSRGGLTSTP